MTDQPTRRRSLFRRPHSKTRGSGWSATAGWLRATGRAHREFWVTSAMTVALMLNTALLAPFGLSTVATGYAIVATIVMVGASLPALFTAFGPRFAKV